MSSNIFVFIGDNAFALLSERRRWVREFTQKHGDANFLSLDGPTIDGRFFFEEVAAMPFVSSKRLMVVDGVPKLTKEDISTLPERLHPQSVVLFVLLQPDRRLAVTKELLRVGNVREFPLLSPQALRRWATHFLAPSSIEDGAWLALLNLVGSNQEFLSQELQKLSLFAAGRNVSQQDIEELVVPAGEIVLWKLTDLLASGRIGDSLAYAWELLRRGEDPQSLWNILLWMLKNLVLTRAAIEEGERFPERIAAKVGVPFASVRALLPLAEHSSLPFLSRLIAEVMTADGRLKSGGYRITAEEPEELLALIDRFILRFEDVGARS